MSTYIIVCVFIFIIGLIFGSFYNVVGYRLPNDMSIAFPNSHCPNCKHKLKFYELIPVLSYIFLLGKCKNCKKHISFIYPFFEIITGLLFLFSYIKFGININFFINITFISILIIITISDLRSFIIPNEVLLVGSGILVIEFIINIYLNDLSVFNGVISPLLNGVASFSVLYLFKMFGDVVFAKESLGGGDIKLLFVFGLVLGFDMSIVSIFIAAFIALPISIVSLIKKDSNVLPFGPFLSLGAIIIIFANLNLDMILNYFIN